MLTDSVTYTDWQMPELSQIVRASNDCISHLSAGALQACGHR
jgi:hypothetical protein